MNIDPTGKWHDDNTVAEMLSAIKKIKGHSIGDWREAVHEMVTVADLQRQGIADVFEVVHKITEYNKDMHEQFGKQIDIARTLIKTVKRQEKQIAKLDKQLNAMKAKLVKKKPGATLPGGKMLKRLGWFS